MRWIEKTGSSLLHISFGIIVICLISAESYFLSNNFSQLLAERKWIVLPLSLNPTLPFSHTILLSPDHPDPVLISAPDNLTLSSNTWISKWFGADSVGSEESVPIYKLNYDPMQDTPSCSWNARITNESNSQKTWYVSGEDKLDRKPSFAFVMASLAGIVLRWTMIIFYVVISIGTSSFASWRTLTSWKARLAMKFQNSIFIFLYAYVCSLSLSLCTIAVEISDCLEWWAFGGSSFGGMRIFSLQPTFWIVSAAGVIGFFAPITVFLVRRKLTSSPPASLKIKSVLYCIGLLYFSFSSGIVSVIVLIVGLSKLWILMIWLTLFVLSLDFHCKNCLQENINYRARNGANRVLIIGSPEEEKAMIEMLPCFSEFLEPADAKKEKAARRNFRVDEIIAKEGPLLEVDDSFLASSLNSASSTPRSPSKNILRTIACVVCLDRSADCVLLPCSHLVICCDCFRELVRFAREHVTRQYYTGSQTLRNRLRAELANPDSATSIGAIHCPLCRTSVSDTYYLQPKPGIDLRSEEFVVGICVWKASVLQSASSCESEG